MNKKAEKFQNFIKSRHLEHSFVVSEHQANGRDFVIFESSVVVKKEHLRLMLILDQGLQTRKQIHIYWGNLIARIT